MGALQTFGVACCGGRGVFFLASLSYVGGAGARFHVMGVKDNLCGPRLTSVDRSAGAVLWGRSLDGKLIYRTERSSFWEGLT